MTTWSRLKDHMSVYFLPLPLMSLSRLLHELRITDHLSGQRESVFLGKITRGPLKSHLTGCMLSSLIFRYLVVSVQTSWRWFSHRDLWGTNNQSDNCICAQAQTQTSPYSSRSWKIHAKINSIRHSSRYCGWATSSVQCLLFTISAFIISHDFQDGSPITRFVMPSNPHVSLFEDLLIFDVLLFALSATFKCTVASL